MEMLSRVGLNSVYLKGTRQQAINMGKDMNLTDEQINDYIDRRSDPKNRPSSDQEVFRTSLESVSKLVL